jgi:hypothetical protein
MDTGFGKRKNDRNLSTRRKTGFFFVTMAALDHEPTPAEIAKIFADNEMEVVGPPLKIK